MQKFVLSICFHWHLAHIFGGLDNNFSWWLQKFDQGQEYGVNHDVFCRKWPFNMGRWGQFPFGALFARYRRKLCQMCVCQHDIFEDQLKCTSQNYATKYIKIASFLLYFPLFTHIICTAITTYYLHHCTGFLRYIQNNGKGSILLHILAFYM